MEPNTTRPRLEPWGWDPSFERAFELMARPGTSPARVVAQHRERWRVVIESQEAGAVAAGRLLEVGPYPVVGDWVMVEGADAPGSVLRIVDVVPRRGAFRRRAAGSDSAEQLVAANADLVLILTALPSDLNLRRLERYLTLAWEAAAVPVVVLTKADLSPEPERAIAEAESVALGVEVMAVSSVDGAGLDALRSRLPARSTALLLGSSGVGKSTLLNRLLGEGRARTGAVLADGRGRHVTTARALFRTPWGALVVDTPGMREVGLWAEAAALEASFPDVDAPAGGCRFRDCMHDTEPGCAVHEAVTRGELSAARLESWHRLRRELAHLERRDDPLAAAAEAARWRMLHRSMRDHLKRREWDGG